MDVARQLKNAKKELSKQKVGITILSSLPKSMQEKLQHSLVKANWMHQLMSINKLS